MKKIRFSLLLVLALGIAACEPKNDPEPTPPPTPPAPADAVSASVADLTFPNQGTASLTFTLTSNVDWTIAGSDTKAVPSWFGVSPASGKSGSNTITVTLKESNTTYDDRSGT